MSGVFEQIRATKAAGQKQLAVLIDPDKATPERIAHLCQMFAEARPDLIFVGGSLVMSEVEAVVCQLKTLTDVPVVLFPGNASQLAKGADAVLFLSLISGRNPEYLIGQHVNAAPLIRQMRMESIPTGYMLIDGGTHTAVEYISGTQPIPSEKSDIAVATAMAGEMLGLKMLYLEAGSGAQSAVPCHMIERVKKSVDIPIIVGGGLRTPEAVDAACKAGADIVVVGTAIENNPDVYHSMRRAVDSAR